MPEGNLETLVSAYSGGSCDNKIVCETLATTEAIAEKSVEEESSMDFLPESFWLSKDAEFDWFDRNAFYERKDSHKGNSASSNSTNLNHNSNSDSNSQHHHQQQQQQRFLVKKSKASSIIGLPKKPQTSCFIEIKNRTKPGNNTRLLFPKRSGSVKSDPTLVEPSSPKVSCMGRVRSRRDRNRNRMKSDKVETVKENTMRIRSGCFLSFCYVFRSHGKAREPCILPVLPSPPRNSDIRSRLPPDDREAISIVEPEITETEPVVEPVCLGGMKRFASGRRSEPLI